MESVLEQKSNLPSGNGILGLIRYLLRISLDGIVPKTQGAEEASRLDKLSDPQWWSDIKSTLMEIECMVGEMVPRECLELAEMENSRIATQLNKVREYTRACEAEMLAHLVSIEELIERSTETALTKIMRIERCIRSISISSSFDQSQATIVHLADGNSHQKTASQAKEWSNKFQNGMQEQSNMFSVQDHIRPMVPREDFDTYRPEINTLKCQTTLMQKTLKGMVSDHTATKDTKISASELVGSSCDLDKIREELKIVPDNLCTRFFLAQIPINLMDQSSNWEEVQCEIPRSKSKISLDLLEAIEAKRSVQGSECRSLENSANEMLSNIGLDQAHQELAEKMKASGIEAEVTNLIFSNMGPKLLDKRENEVWALSSEIERLKAQISSMVTKASYEEMQSKLHELQIEYNRMKSDMSQMVPIANNEIMTIENLKLRTRNRLLENTMRSEKQHTETFLVGLLVRQWTELLQPADGQPYIGSIDVGGEFYGTGDGSGKAFWPGTGPYDSFGLYGYVAPFPAHKLPGKPLLDGILSVGH